MYRRPIANRGEDAAASREDAPKGVAAKSHLKFYKANPNRARQQTDSPDNDGEEREEGEKREPVRPRAFGSQIGSQARVQANPMPSNKIRMQATRMQRTNFTRDTRRKDEDEEEEEEEEDDSGQAEEQPKAQTTSGAGQRLGEYEVLERLGDGAYGIVSKCKHSQTGELFAVKTIKQRRFNDVDECESMREVKMLKKLDHPNIVKLVSFFLDDHELQIVFELMEDSLGGIIKNKPHLLTETSTRSVVRQILSGLAYLHEKKLVHRDIKPENILCKHGVEIAQIADFDLTREIRLRHVLTEYVSTRWYRAPEILLRYAKYNSPVDLWAVGCIIAELYTHTPLFPGFTEIDQIYKIMSALGTLTNEIWPEGYVLLQSKHLSFTQGATPLESIIPRIGKNGLKLISDLFEWNPSKRPTAIQALEYAYLSEFSSTSEQGETASSSEATKSETKETPVSDATTGADAVKAEDGVVVESKAVDATTEPSTNE